MPCPLRLFNSYSLKWQHFIFDCMNYSVSNTSGLLYTLAIRVVCSFGITLRGMCKVTPYMEAATACHGISVICHTLQYYIIYIPWCSALIFTPSVVHKLIYSSTPVPMPGLHIAIVMLLHWYYVCNNHTFCQG